MKNKLSIDFSVNKENYAIKVRREFMAPLKHVWAAWTKKEILDQWWAPKPLKSETKEMDFREGGRRLYAMVSPEGLKQWSFVEYKSITPKSNFKCRCYFCDSEGNINREMPLSDWNVDFIESDGLTIVHIYIQHKNLSDLEKAIEMGFREGFTAILDELAEILPAISNH